MQNRNLRSSKIDILLSFKWKEFVEAVELELKKKSASMFPSTLNIMDNMNIEIWWLDKLWEKKSVLIHLYCLNLWHQMASWILVNIGSGNGLLPDWYQVITQTSAFILLINWTHGKKKCKMSAILFRFLYFNSLWPSDAIWQHRSGSTLAQVMACCLTAPSHYLNQCWLIISEVRWQSPEDNFTITATSNDRHGILNYWSIEYLFNSLFRLTTRKHQRSALLSH